MNTQTLLHSMLRDLWQDMQDPAVFWQLGVLIACLAVAWWRARATRRGFRDEAARAAADEALAADGAPAGGADAARVAASRRMQLLRSSAARQAISKVLLPLYALVLVAIARPILGIWQSTNLLRLATSLLVALALVRVIVYVISRLARTRALATFERLLILLVWIGTALYVTGYWAELVEIMQSVVLPVGKQRISLWALLSSGFWLLVTLLAALWLGGAAETRLMANDTLDASTRAVLARLLRALLLLLAVLLGLSLVGLDLTTLSVFGGAVGVGIGLGLQRIASNYVSGFIVLFERMVRIGDMVRVDQLSGRVQEIRTRFTVLRGLDGIDHIIPNEMLTSLPVQNSSRVGRIVGKASVQVAYSTDVDRAMQVAVEATRTVPRVLADPPPVALISGLAADGINLDIVFWVGNPHMGSGGVVAGVYAAVWKAFVAAGINVPYPQREIRILSGPLNG